MEGWIDQITTALAALGLKLINVVVGAISAFVALNFWKGLESRRDRWITFGGGWMLAAWGAGPLREFVEAKPSLEVLIVMLMGLFGMALAAEIIKVIRETDWRGMVREVFDFLLRKRGQKGD